MPQKLNADELKNAILQRYQQTHEAVTIPEIARVTGRSISWIRERLSDLPGATPEGLVRVQVKRQATTFGGSRRYKPVLAYRPTRS